VIADMHPLESDNKVVTYHYCFACSLLDLQADSRTRMQNDVPPRGHVSICILTSLSML